MCELKGNDLRFVVVAMGQFSQKGIPETTIRSLQIWSVRLDLVVSGIPFCENRPPLAGATTPPGPSPPGPPISFSYTS